MFKTTEYDDQIIEYQKKIKAIESVLLNLLKMRAEKLCPFKVGDVIRDKWHSLNAKITRVDCSQSDYTRELDYIKPYEMYGKICLKSGKLSEKEKHLPFYVDWEKLEN